MKRSKSTVKTTGMIFAMLLVLAMASGLQAAYAQAK